MLKFDGKNTQILTKYQDHLGHLKNNPRYAFIWNVLMTGSINDREKKNLEASFPS